MIGFLVGYWFGSGHDTGPTSEEIARSRFLRGIQYAGQIALLVAYAALCLAVVILVAGVAVGLVVGAVS